MAAVNRIAAAGRGTELARAWQRVEKDLPPRLLARREHSLSLAWPDGGR